tara:strand:+ start:295 stop:1992 length:1698 start_codon:yes stop_codon:yes gene_type:complete
MNSVISDQYVIKSIGENGHLQNDWSNDIKKKFVELYFQMVRCNDHTDLEKQWRMIIESFKGNEKTAEFNSVIKMVANTRDIIDGKGEQQLSFMLLYVLFDYYPELSKFIFVKFITMEDEHCLGSLKDIKYFCDYIKNKSDKKHPLIDYILSISYDLLKKDECSLNKGGLISLFGKWFPRSKSKKFGWINRRFAEIYYYKIMKTVGKQGKQGARRKCLTKLRQLLSRLNKHLDTTQIKMTTNEWSKIDFNKVTGPTLRVHKKSFQNIDKIGKLRSTYKDRIHCSTNLKKYLQTAKEGSVVVKGQRVDMYKLVKDAYNALTTEDIDIVNEQWKDNSNVNKEMKNYFIPIIDVSATMKSEENVPMYNSIGFGIRVAEKTHPNFRNRILTFGEIPTWIQLTDDMTFHQKVTIMKDECFKGGKTNFYKALQMILDVYVENNILPVDVEKMILLLFSDFQINTAFESTYNLATMMENIKLMYNEAGLRTCWKIPYKVPHILLWNLRKTDGFPSSVYEPNASMFSGYNPVLLNKFAEKGIKKVVQTPFTMLLRILNNNRYKFIDSCIHKYFK